MSEIIQLYKEEEKITKVYPKTVASEVYIDSTTTVIDKINEVSTQIEETVSYSVDNTSEFEAPQIDEKLEIVTQKFNELNGEIQEIIQEIGNVNDISTTPTELQGQDLVTRINKAFQYASDGKQKLATAITGKGIETSVNASFDEIVANINNLSNVLVDGVNIKEKVEFIKSDFKDWVKKLNNALPYKCYQGKAVIYNGEIHILGSSNDGEGTKHYKWNGKEWVSVSTLPYVFYDGSAVVYNDEIHILGGFETGTTKKHYKYNGKEWIEVSTLPKSFYDGKAVVYGGLLHILVGSYFYKYDNSTWVSVGTLPYSLSYSSVIEYNNEIHILGAMGANSTKHYKYNGSTWVEASTLPYSFYTGTVAVCNDELHLIGGYGMLNKINHYKWNGTSWSELGKMLYNYKAGMSVTLNDEIYVLGGGVGDYTTFSVYCNLYKLT